MRAFCPIIVCVVSEIGAPSEPELTPHRVQQARTRALIIASKAATGSDACYSSGVNRGKARHLAFIFDLDGVLINSMPLHVLAWQEYLANLGIRVEDLERRMHGKRNAELVEDLIGSGLDDEVVFRHGAAKEQLWRDMVLRNGIEEYRIPGLVEFLERHEDVPKAVASNAEPQNIDFVLDHYNLRRFFRVAVNGLEVSRPKPFPDVYLEAARRLGADPRDCVVFEDSPTGLQAGIEAGMKVVGIETTSTELGGAAIQVKGFLDPRLERWLTEERTHDVL